MRRVIPRGELVNLIYILDFLQRQTRINSGYKQEGQVCTLAKTAANGIV